MGTEETCQFDSAKSTMVGAKVLALWALTTEVGDSLSMLYWVTADIVGK